MAAPRELSIRSVRDPEEVLDAALHYFGGEGGWTVTSRTETAATFAYDVRPGCGVALLLALLGLIPGLLYWFFARHTAAVTITSTCRRSGSRTLISWSHDGDCRGPCEDFVAMIEGQEPGAGDSRRRRLTSPACVS